MDRNARLCFYELIFLTKYNETKFQSFYANNPIRLTHADDTKCKAQSTAARNSRANELPRRQSHFSLAERYIAIVLPVIIWKS